MEALYSLNQGRTSVNLSLVATVFLPLTFLTGIFGMNFTVDDSSNYSIGWLGYIQLLL